MKRILLLSLVLGHLSSASAATIAFWAQDESGGNLLDSTGNHPPGIPTGSPTYGLPGVPAGVYGGITVLSPAGTSIEYGPSNLDEFFTIGSDTNNPVMNLDRTSAFTVMGWMNPAAPTAASTYRMVSTGSAAGADRGWGFGLRLGNTAGTNSSLRFTTYGVADNDSSTFSVSFGSWMHLAATYNNGSISYFLNGNALDSDTSLFGNEGTAGRLVVGGRLGANDVDQANGLLDGLQVYNEILTVDQIRNAAALSVSVPEPSTLILGALGGAAIYFAARRRKIGPMAR
jgi:hypothetical protein